MCYRSSLPAMKRKSRASVLAVVERLSALMAEWPCADICHFLKRCDIGVPNRQPPGNQSRRWLIQKSLGALNWANAMDVVRLQMLCNIVIDAALYRIATQGCSAKVVTRRMAEKAEDLKTII